MTKKILAYLLVLCLLIAGCSGGKTAKLDKDLVVLYTNDVHCAVDSAIGYAGLAALRRQMADEGNYVALVDCGDAIQGAPIGTVTKGEDIVTLMDQVGYDVAIPGNHEFDYGMDRFLELAGKASFPYVSVNFTDLRTDKAVFPGYVIKEYNGVKVAFVGVSTPKTITSSTPTYFQDGSGNYIYGFCEDGTGEKLYAAVQTAVDAAKKEGARYIVCLSHLGIAADASPYMSTELIANTSGIDVVLDGHSHSVLECERVTNKEGKKVLLSSTGTGLEAVGMLVITRDGSISTGLIKDYDQKDAAVEASVKSMQEALDASLNTVVAHTSVDLTIMDPTATDVRIIRNAETSLGDLCADAYRAATGADIALVNGGGIRASIPAGDITYGQIIAVNPYGNLLCMVEATGQQVLDALEMGARATPAENGGFLQVSGLTYQIDTSVESSVKLDDKGMFVSVDGPYRVTNVLVDGKPLQLDKTYTVASHNYLIKSAGDGMTMFQNDKLLMEDTALDNQVLINYITEILGGTVGEAYKDPYGEGRITVVGQ